jgi:hypothetical protein
MASRSRKSAGRAERWTLLPRQPITDEESRDLLQTMDGHKWANAFCRGTGFPDEGWALSWFCTAIMVGYDHGVRKGTADRAPAPPVARRKPRAKRRRKVT